MRNLEPTPFWLDRPVFVSGGAGFVGSWLIRRLSALGAEVVCLVRDHFGPAGDPAKGIGVRSPGGGEIPVRLVTGDVCDSALLERVLGEYEVRTIFHLAAQTIVPIADRNPASTFESNVAGTWRLLEASRRSPLVEQVIVASSDKAYGESDSASCDETAPLRGRQPYAVSKSCCDLIAQSYAATYGLPVAITRCGNFYGGGDRNWNRIVPGTIRSALRGERPVIRSDGRHVREYLYVEDGAAAYTLLAEKLAEKPELSGEAFNFSNECGVTVLDLVRQILRAMGSELDPDVRDEARDEIRCQRLDSGKARELLGWRPMSSLEDGLRQTIQWYREFLQRRSEGRPG